MKKLYLIFHGRFPSEKAASLFAAKSCEAFAGQGFDVTLLVPRRRGVTTTESPFTFYGVKRNFRVEYIWTVDLFSFAKGLAFWVSFVAFSVSVYFYMMKCAKREDVVFSNESLPLFILSWNFKNTFYEMHDFPESKRYLFGKFLSRMRWVLIHNRWKMEETKKLFPNISSKKFLYEPNAVDVAAFDINISKEEARKRTGLPAHKRVVVYTGHLYGWKGTDTLAAAAQLLPDEYVVVFVGGTPEDIKKFKDTYKNQKNILIVGFKPHNEIPLWQKAADVLVLPNTAKEKISAYYTSPMKLFEYMASSRPIVASDLPAIREIVDEKTAYVVTPDDAESLARGLEKAATAEDVVSSEAHKKVLNHTWDKRAFRITMFMSI